MNPRKNFHFFWKKKWPLTSAVFGHFLKKKPKLWTRPGPSGDSWNLPNDLREPRPQFLPPKGAQPGSLRTPKMSLINFPIFEPLFQKPKFLKILAKEISEPEISQPIWKLTTYVVSFWPENLRPDQTWDFWPVLTKSRQKPTRTWPGPGQKRHLKWRF